MGCGCSSGGGNVVVPHQVPRPLHGGVRGAAGVVPANGLRPTGKQPDSVSVAWSQLLTQSIEYLVLLSSSPIDRGAGAAKKLRDLDQPIVLARDHASRVAVLRSIIGMLNVITANMQPDPSRLGPLTKTILPDMFAATFFLTDHWAGEMARTRKSFADGRSAKLAAYHELADEHDDMTNLLISLMNVACWHPLLIGDLLPPQLVALARHMMRVVTDWSLLPSFRSSGAIGLLLLMSEKPFGLFLVRYNKGELCHELCRTLLTLMTELDARGLEEDVPTVLEDASEEVVEHQAILERQCALLCRKLFAPATLQTAEVATAIVHACLSACEPILRNEATLKQVCQPPAELDGAGEAQSTGPSEIARYHGAITMLRFLFADAEAPVLQAALVRSMSRIGPLILHPVLIDRWLMREPRDHAASVLAPGSGDLEEGDADADEDQEAKANDEEGEDGEEEEQGDDDDGAEAFLDGTISFILTAVFAQAPLYTALLAASTPAQKACLDRIWPVSRPSDGNGVFVPQPWPLLQMLTFADVPAVARMIANEVDLEEDEAEAAAADGSAAPVTDMILSCHVHFGYLLNTLSVLVPRDMRTRGVLIDWLVDQTRLMAELLARFYSVGFTAALHEPVPQPGGCKQAKKRLKPATLTASQASFVAGLSYLASQYVRCLQRTIAVPASAVPLPPGDSLPTARLVSLLAFLLDVSAAPPGTDHATNFLPMAGVIALAELLRSSASVLRAAAPVAFAAAVRTSLAIVDGELVRVAHAMEAANVKSRPAKAGKWQKPSKEKKATTPRLNARILCLLHTLVLVDSATAWSLVQRVATPAPGADPSKSLLLSQLFWPQPKPTKQAAEEGEGDGDDEEDEKDPEDEPDSDDFERILPRATRVRFVLELYAACLQVYGPTFRSIHLALWNGVNGVWESYRRYPVTAAPAMAEVMCHVPVCLQPVPGVASAVGAAERAAEELLMWLEDARLIISYYSGRDNALTPLTAALATLQHQFGGLHWMKRPGIVELHSECVSSLQTALISHLRQQVREGQPAIAPSVPAFDLFEHTSNGFVWMAYPTLGLRTTSILSRMAAQQTTDSSPPPAELHAAYARQLAIFQRQLLRQPTPLLNDELTALPRLAIVLQAQWPFWQQAMAVEPAFANGAIFHHLGESLLAAAQFSDVREPTRATLVPFALMALDHVVRYLATLEHAPLTTNWRSCSNVVEGAGTLIVAARALAIGSPQQPTIDKCAAHLAQLLPIVDRASQLFAAEWPFADDALRNRASVADQVRQATSRLANFTVPLPLGPIGSTLHVHQPSALFFALMLSQCEDGTKPSSDSIADGVAQRVAFGTLPPIARAYFLTIEQVLGETRARRTRSNALLRQRGIPVMESLPCCPSMINVAPRDQMEIYTRMVVMLNVSMLPFANKPNVPVAERPSVLKAMQDKFGHGIRRHFASPSELHAIQRPWPEWTPGMFDDLSWLNENIYFLAWLLHILPDQNAISTPPIPNSTMGLLDSIPLPILLSLDSVRSAATIYPPGQHPVTLAARRVYPNRPDAGQLPSVAQLVEFSDVLYRYHWAAVHTGQANRSNDNPARGQPWDPSTGINYHAVCAWRRTIDWLLWGQEWDLVSMDT